MIPGGDMRDHAAFQYVHLSNLLTYVSLGAGLSAVFSASAHGSWSITGGLLAVSALADTLDGRFAALFPRTGRQKAFGVELDSLTDALVFGLVPVVCLDLLLAFDSGAARALWGVAAFAYVVGAITRLGFFDLYHAECPGFVGLPTTVAGLVWSSVFLARPSVAVSGGLLLAIGVAMVSAVPIPRPRRLGLVAFGGWAVVLVILHGVAVIRP